MKVRLTNIQRFCLNDGPGIRTTVFLKGCNLRCPWCANPENMKFDREVYENKSKKGIYGIDMDDADLFNEIIKDKSYFLQSGGGVTFSGGEALLQSKVLLPLLIKLKEEGINVCFETALMVPTELVREIISYVDLFIVDIKILDKDKAREVLKGDIQLYYDNLELLKSMKKDIIFRIPLVKGYTINDGNIEKIIELLSQFVGYKVEIFKIHNLAESKYASLGLEMKKLELVSDNEINKLSKRLSELGINVEIIRI